MAELLLLWQLIRTKISITKTEKPKYPPSSFLSQFDNQISTPTIKNSQPIFPKCPITIQHIIDQIFQDYSIKLRTLQKPLKLDTQIQTDEKKYIETKKA